MTRDPHTYRWARRNYWFAIKSLLALLSWSDFNEPQPGAYNIGSTPALMQKDAEIDHGRSKYRRAHGGKREQARRHARLLIKMVDA
jgi:hypothetical protein